MIEPELTLLQVQVECRAAHAAELPIDKVNLRFIVLYPQNLLDKPLGITAHGSSSATRTAFV